MDKIDVYYKKKRITTLISTSELNRFVSWSYDEENNDYFQTNDISLKALTKLKKDDIPLIYFRSDRSWYVTLKKGRKTIDLGEFTFDILKTSEFPIINELLTNINNKKCTKVIDALTESINLLSTKTDYYKNWSEGAYKLYCKSLGKLRMLLNICMNNPKFKISIC